MLCVHSALSALGHVIGGPRTVVEGLIDAVGADGTLMMPAYSGDLSDPAEWRHPPRSGLVGAAESALFPAPAAVNAVVEWRRMTRQ